LIRDPDPELKFFDADPGWKKFGSGISIPDPQHGILYGYESEVFF
jgi:hypothetical protein